MEQVAFRAPPELVEEIDKQRASEASETGQIQSRSEWLRNAAREKLDINYTEQPETGAA